MTDESTLDCGHPIQCLSCKDDEDEFPVCEWCEQVGQLNETVSSLTNCLEKQAIVVREGAELTMMCKIVGYMAQYGGTIHMDSGLAHVISEQQETA